MSLFDDQKIKWQKTGWEKGVRKRIIYDSSFSSYFMPFQTPFLTNQIEILMKRDNFKVLSWRASGKSTYSIYKKKLRIWCRGKKGMVLYIVQREVRLYKPTCTGKNKSQSFSELSSILNWVSHGGVSGVKLFSQSKVSHFPVTFSTFPKWWQEHSFTDEMLRLSFSKSDVDNGLRNGVELCCTFRLKGRHNIF
jgi:hypothetical protein